MKEVPSAGAGFAAVSCCTLSGAAVKKGRFMHWCVLSLEQSTSAAESSALSEMSAAEFVLE